MAPPVLRSFAILALVGLLFHGLSRPRAAEPGTEEAGKADLTNVQRAFQVGIWSYDLIVVGISRPGLVMRFEADGTFDGTSVTWTQDGRRAGSDQLSGRWSLTSLGEHRFRIDLTLDDGDRRSATFRRLGPDQVLNEHTGRRVDRVPQYADS